MSNFSNDSHWGGPNYIIRCPNTWPANNCPQKMFCSCVIPLTCVLLQIIFCSSVIVTEPRSCAKWQIASRAVTEWFKYETNHGNQKIKQLSKSVIAEYRDLSEFRCSPLMKSRYFAQPRPIIAYRFTVSPILLRFGDKCGCAVALCTILPKAPQKPFFSLI